MNLYYIEFMIRERRREEIERCNRMRMLASAGYTTTSFKQRMTVAFSQVCFFWKKWREAVNKVPDRVIPYRITSAKPKGKSV